MSKWTYMNNDGKHIINNERGVLIAMVCDEDIAIDIVHRHRENERLHDENQSLRRSLTREAVKDANYNAEIARLRKELEEAQMELNLTQSEVQSVERLGLKYQSRIKELSTPRPLEEWHEDYGDVLWWELHVAEPPYCGNPLCSDWPGYHTHWTPIVTPNFGQEGEGNQDANS
ncbi:hypothetical protein [Paenibacillus sp. UASWS1643]|uniref:hypothetical protein n=1 Tax=Paenibacillus sp. UASWS1643 TaxID=2580422 RepID=UPI00123A75A6|nr:hypothetical protein [Paenibacillus sp. UASWS1643]KAA8747132.1 hypothetical protein FE296_23385 [Paenibacillus sp. UASWS1643]